MAKKKKKKTPTTKSKMKKKTSKKLPVNYSCYAPFQLQPGCGNLPAAERHLQKDPGPVPLPVPHGHGRQHGGQLHCG